MQALPAPAWLGAPASSSSSVQVASSDPVEYPPAQDHQPLNQGVPNWSSPPRRSRGDLVSLLTGSPLTVDQVMGTSSMLQSWSSPPTTLTVITPPQPVVDLAPIVHYYPRASPEPQGGIVMMDDMQATSHLDNNNPLALLSDPNGLGLLTSWERPQFEPSYQPCGGGITSLSAAEEVLFRHPLFRTGEGEVPEVVVPPVPVPLPREADVQPDVAPPQMVPVDCHHHQMYQPLPQPLPMPSYPVSSSVNRKRRARRAAKPKPQEVKHETEMAPPTEVIFPDGRRIRHPTAEQLSLMNFESVQHFQAVVAKQPHDPNRFYPDPFLGLCPTIPFIRAAMPVNVQSV